LSPYVKNKIRIFFFSRIALIEKCKDAREKLGQRAC